MVKLNGPIKVYVGSFVAIDYHRLPREVQPCNCGRGEPSSNYCCYCGAAKVEEVVTEFDGLTLLAVQMDIFIYSCPEWASPTRPWICDLPPSRYLSGSDLDKAVPLMLIGGVIRNNSIVVVEEIQ